MFSPTFSLEMLEQDSYIYIIKMLYNI